MSQDVDKDLGLDVAGGDFTGAGKTTKGQRIKKDLEKGPVRMVLIFFVVMVVVVLAFIKIRMNNSADAAAPASTVATAPGGIDTTPGADGSSQRYEALVADANDQRAAEAAATGGSAIHSIAGKPAVPIQEQPPLPPVPQVVYQEPPRPAPEPSESSEGRSSAVSNSVKALMGLWAPGGQRVVRVGECCDDKQAVAAAAPAPGKSVELQEKPSVVTRVFDAGDISMAETDLEINTDIPGNTVRATIIAGPHRGGVLLGSYSAGKETAGLTFTTLKSPLYKDALQINAIAIDPSMSRIALTGGVDKHYLLRYGTMMATSFISGFADAVSRSNTTTTSSLVGTTTSYGELDGKDQVAVALGKVGDNFANSFNDIVNMPTTITIPSKTQFGLMMLQAVDVSVVQ